MSNTEVQAAIALNDDDREEEDAPAAAAPEVTPEGAVVKIPKYCAVMVTPVQYAAIKAFAGDRAISGVLLQIVADAVGFTVDPKSVKAARVVGLTPEERKAAQVVKVKAKSLAVAEYLAAHAAEFELLLAAKAEEVKARMLAEAAAQAAEAPTA